MQLLTSTTFGYLFDMYQHGCDELGITSYDYLQILDKILTQEPHNLLAQEQKYELLYNHIAPTIHEVPSGVLFGANSASIDETDVLLKELNEFEQYTKSINKIKPPIIDEARFYYLAWIDYLQSTENLNFLEHLQKHHDCQIDE